MTVFQPMGGGGKSSCGKGFTLAEVLITLGIIGVVAALTLPTLIANYQKQVYVNQLKKSVSSLSQGFALMMGKDGVTELKDTEAFGGMSVVCSSSNFDSDSCKTLREGLQNTFSGITFTKENISMKSLNGVVGNLSNTCVIRFPDGSYLFQPNFYLRDHMTNGVMKGVLGVFYLDVNGSKNPNTAGRDIFYLYLGNVGGVYPHGSQVVSVAMNNGNENTQYWRTTSDPSYDCKMDGSSYGIGCAARVLEEGKMDY